MKTYVKILVLALTAGAAWYLSVFAAEEKNENFISADTQICKITEYTDCNHTETVKIPASKDLMGLSTEKAAEKLGSTLKSYENKMLTVSKEHNGFCGKHCKVILEEGNKITVYRLSTGKKKAEYPVSPSQFSDSDIKRLKTGIRTDSAAELSAILEDYTS